MKDVKAGKAGGGKRIKGSREMDEQGETGRAEGGRRRDELSERSFRRKSAKQK